MIATKRFTVDSNVLIYSVDKSDPTKQQIAARIVQALAARKGPLSLQCLHEFYRATTRDRKRILSPVDATLIVRDFLPAFTIIEGVQDDLLLAMEFHQKYQMQYFDALLLATTSRAG